MKKHPIDEVFRRKLSNIKIEPSENAWKKISNKNNTKQRVFVSLKWYVAASAVFASMFTYMIWQQEASSHIENQQVNKVQKYNIHQETTLLSANTKKSNENVGEELTTIKPILLEKLARVVKAKHPKVLDLSDAENKTSKSGIVIPVAEIIVRPIETAQIELNPKVEHTLISKIEVNEDLSTNDRIIIIKVETSEEGQNKPGRLVKLFKQLKNVKDGEPVDWNEFGIRPKNIFARVDEN